ncbi:hypothetical protein J6590_030602, partial [Homalodisca vitripennis]
SRIVFTQSAVYSTNSKRDTSVTTRVDVIKPGVVEAPEWGGCFSTVSHGGIKSSCRHNLLPNPSPNRSMPTRV